eukprot:scaffold10856_cov229-Amphora_coffeaeformis.AAC.15
MHKDAQSNLLHVGVVRVALPNTRDVALASSDGVEFFAHDCSSIAHSVQDSRFVVLAFKFRGPWRDTL